MAGAVLVQRLGGKRYCAIRHAKPWAKPVNFAGLLFFRRTAGAEPLAGVGIVDLHGVAVAGGAALHGPFDVFRVDRMELHADFGLHALILAGFACRSTNFHVSARGIHNGPETLLVRTRERTLV